MLFFFFWSSFSSVVLIPPLLGVPVVVYEINGICCPETPLAMEELGSWRWDCMSTLSSKYFGSGRNILSRRENR
jgi:hypothetical protein